VVNYNPDLWRVARVEVFKAALNGWLVVAESVTVKPTDRVYDLRQVWAKQERVRLQDVRFVPLLDFE
jgi:hypothetical protein